MFRKTQNIHFVGIGGIGMSGIAEVLINLGYNISGSDAFSSDITDSLVKAGAKIYEGHNASHTDGADVVVISSAISQDNVEIKRAREKYIPVIPRAEMLAELMRLKHGIAIAGTHGKTTTTSMIATVLAYGGLDPTVVIGGKLNSLGSGAKLGEGELLVAEADESDGSFLKLSPTITVVTTIDEEHMDFYKNMDNLLDSFLAFINKVPFYGVSILCLDQPYIQSMIPGVNKRYITYGLKTQADYTAMNIKTSGLQTSFSVYSRHKRLGDILINMPGIHNVLNSLASVAVGLELDIKFETIRTGLENFSGVQRRFQIVGEKNKVTIVDDYAHHPVEIKYAIEAARDVWEKRRIFVVFQPHRYTRTQNLMEKFFTIFYDADVLVITDIYPAGEQPIKGVNAELIYNGIKRHGHRHIHYIKDKREIVQFLSDEASADDVIMTLGAGDIWKVGRDMLERLAI